jgi:hypothetical protein
MFEKRKEGGLVHLTEGWLGQPDQGVVMLNQIRLGYFRLRIPD